MTRNFKKFIAILGIFSLFLIILGYAYYRSRDLISGVNLKVSGIQNGEMFENPSVEVFGRAKNAKHLTLNGREIFLNDDWDFREKILLWPGYNLITLKTEDKFGKIKEKDYQVMLVSR